MSGDVRATMARAVKGNNSLTAEDRGRAIPRNEAYNLLAGRPQLPGALAGKPINEARREFRGFAAVMARGGAGEPLLRVAEHYASF